MAIGIQAYYEGILNALRVEAEYVPQPILFGTEQPNKGELGQSTNSNLNTPTPK